jgi:hypothetical protein
MGANLQRIPYTLEHGFPFVRSARVRYLRPGAGELHGRAKVAAEDIARVLAELDVDYAFRPAPGEKK